MGKKLIDIDKKAEDLKSKFKDIPGATDKIDSWAKQAKLFTIEESGKKDFDEARKVYIEGLKDQRELDKELTQSKASELEKRTLQVDEAAKKQRALVLSALNAEAIDFDTYNKKISQINEEATRLKIKLKDESNKTSREAEINGQLIALDLIEKEGTKHSETINERIRLLNEMKTIQEGFLNTLDKSQDPTAWYAQANAIKATQKALAELKVEASQQDWFGALGISLRNTANDLTNLFENVNGVVKKTFSGMTDALTDFVMSGKLNFTDFANSVIKDMVRIMIQQQVTGPLAKAAGNINWFELLGSEKSGAKLGTVDWTGAFGVKAPVEHGGGVLGKDAPAFYRIVPSPVFAGAPRYHSGIGPGERAAIIREDEGVFTPGQMKAMGLARGGPQSIRIEVLDKSGAKVSASQPEVRFDAQEMVVSFWIDALQNNKYGLRSMLGR